MRRLTVIILALAILSACSAATSPAPPTQPSVNGTATQHAINLATMDAVPRRDGLTPGPTATQITVPDPTLNLPSPYPGPVPPGATMQLGQGVLTTIALSPDAKMLAVAGSVSLTLYDAISVSRIWVARTSERVSLVKWSPDGSQIALGFWNGSIAVFETRDGRQVYQFASQGKNITSLDWTPGNKRIIATSRNGVGVLWDMQTGELIKTFVRTDGYLSSYYGASDFNSSAGVLSPDGSLFAATYEVGSGDDFHRDDVIVIWDALTGEQLTTLVDERISHVAWAADSRTLYSISMEGRALRWDALTGSRSWDGNYPDVDFFRPASLTLSSDGRWLLASSYSDSRVIDASTGMDAYSLGYPEGIPRWLPDGNTIFSYDTEAESLTFRDGNSGELIRTVANVPRPTAFTPDGLFFFALSDERTPSVARYNTQTGQIEAGFTTGSLSVQSVAWSPDGRWIAAASSRNIRFLKEVSNIIIWDASSGQAVQSINIPRQGGTELSPIDWSPDSRYLAIGHGGVLIWDIETRQITHRFVSGNIYSLAWSPDGTKVAAGFNAGMAGVFDATTGAKLYDIQTGSSPQELYVSAVGWAPDSSELALGDSNGHLISVDGSTGQLLTEYIGLDTATGTQPTVQDIAYAPDGKQMAAITSDGPGGTLLIWPRGNDQPATRVDDPLVTRPSPVGFTSLAWSRDGKQVAIGHGTSSEYVFVYLWDHGNSNPVLLWDVEAGRFAAMLQGHTAEVQSVAFSPDGTQLASGSLDGTVIIWNVAP